MPKAPEKYRRAHERNLARKVERRAQAESRLKAWRSMPLKSQLHSLSGRRGDAIRQTVRIVDAIARTIDLI